VTLPSQRLSDLGLSLPPVARSIPLTGALAALMLSVGARVAVRRWQEHRSRPDGGAEVSVDDAVRCAEIAALNGLAAIADLTGDLDVITRIVRVTVYVASDPGFTEQPRIANGASGLLGDIFGDAGRHARSAVGVAVLPLDSPVEVELVVGVGSTPTIQPL
jgi:enamine deaminase RidA (YjgF/YER057c/UK114 family)